MGHVTPCDSKHTTRVEELELEPEWRCSSNTVRVWMELVEPTEGKPREQTANRYRGVVSAFIIYKWERTCMLSVRVNRKKGQ